VTELQERLRQVLFQIEKNDKNYEVRDRLVWEAVFLAKQLGYKAGISFDAAQPEWPGICIELPTGQVSWHMEQYPDPWDGHTTEEKYQRIHEWVGH
jgi:hypothetical protein